MFSVPRGHRALYLRGRSMSQWSGPHGLILYEYERLAQTRLFQPELTRCWQKKMKTESGIHSLHRGTAPRLSSLRRIYQEARRTPPVTKIEVDDETPPRCRRCSGEGVLLLGWSAPV